MEFYFSNSQGAALDSAIEARGEQGGGLLAHFAAVDPFAQVR
jgi:hypothetical protein